MIQEDMELRRLELYISEVLKKDIYKRRKIENCQRCGCKSYIKYGSYKGIQRYKCKECGKTFSNATNSIWSYSKKETRLWIKFVEFMIEKKSLRFCAKNLRINLVTAFYWRHKILHALTLDATPNTLKGIIYIGKTIIKENFKGIRNMEEIRQSMYRRRNIWIIGAKGDEDSMFIKPVFRDFWDLKLFNEKVYTKIEKKSYIVSYGDRYLSLVAQKHNKKRLINVKDDNRIRYMMLNLMNWFTVFRGVATKYLQRYLSFYILFNLDRMYCCMDLIYNDLLSGNRFIKTNEIRIIKKYMY